jgi:hypothetical protein
MSCRRSAWCFIVFFVIRWNNSCLHSDSFTRFSTQTIPSWALIHELKPFWIWIRIRREIRDNCLKSPTFAVWMWPRKQIQRFQWDQGSQFSGLNETAEADSAVSIRPRKPYQNTIFLIRKTTETDSAVSIRPQNPLWNSDSLRKIDYRLPFPLKGNHKQKQIHM